MNPYRTADPVIDLAQARPMIVLDAPEQTVAEYEGDSGRSFIRDNYANQKLGVSPDDYVVVCAYVSDLRSEPSKPCAFPASRVALLDAHHADGGRRLYDRVAVEVLAKLMAATEDAQIQASHRVNRGDVADLARVGFATEDMVDEAFELADVERRFGEGEGDG